MCWPSPSAMSETPIINRKLSASIFTVGWRCTKPLIGAAANIITPTASTTAAIITGRWRAIPTAVMTESSEKTMSSRTIWPTTPANDARAPRAPWPASPSSPAWISRVLLASRNRPPAMRIRSRPENGCPSRLNHGAVSRMIHASAASNAIRVSMAPARPTRRARPCSCLGSLPARMEMKMMLSMPSTISSTVNVRRPSHASGLVKRLMMDVLERERELELGPRAGPKHRLELRRPPRGRAHAGGNQRIDRAQHVIGQEQPDLILGAPERRIALLDVVAEHLVFQRMVAPAPEEVGTDRTRLIELHRPPVLRRRRIGRDVGILPEGPPREQPYRPVVGLRIEFRNERRTGIAVIAAAFGEALHLLVVLEDGVAPHGVEGPSRDIEREILKAPGLRQRLVIELQEARHEVHLRRQVDRPAILMREQLPRPRHEQRGEWPHKDAWRRLLLLRGGDARGSDSRDAGNGRRQ